MINKIDELNIISYKQYFGEMELSEEEKQIRVDMAEEMEVIFLYLFTVILADLRIRNEINPEYLYGLLETRYLDVVRNQKEHSLSNGKDIEDYVSYISKEIVDSTLNHIDADYYLSLDRAKNLSGNETNTVRNYYNDIQAISDGYTRKKWVTMKDAKVRHSHYLVDEETIGIFDVFEVGNSKMKYPRDYSLGADGKEIAGCRCTVKYLW